MPSYTATGLAVFQKETKFLKKIKKGGHRRNPPSGAAAGSPFHTPPLQHRQVFAPVFAAFSFGAAVVGASGSRLAALGSVMAGAAAGVAIPPTSPTAAALHHTAAVPQIVLCLALRHFFRFRLFFDVIGDELLAKSGKGFNSLLLSPVCKEDISEPFGCPQLAG